MKLAIPGSLSDFQQMMDIEAMFLGGTPQIGDLGSDDYYYEYPVFQSKISVVRNCYTWASEVWEGINGSDWRDPYGLIYTSNTVIEGLNNINATTSNDQITKNGIYGHALFVRAYYHYFLEETFGQPYKPATAHTDLGIPLKLTTNLKYRTVRSSVENVYNQIIADLLQAGSLVPNYTAVRSRPSKSTVFALLSRVYLTMQNYAKAGAYADSSLSINNILKDYNDPDVNKTSDNPFHAFAPPNDLSEVLYPATENNYGTLRSGTTYIDTVLYNSYDSNDWRKEVFFKLSSSLNRYSIKAGYYANTVEIFSGPAVDEMYLTRAECFARNGNKNAALADLNALLVKRWRTGTFIPVTAIDADDALGKILKERRKELIFRALRWIDLRRLNQDPRFAITLKRILNGQVYTLPPNDKKYTYPIPDNEIRINDLPQNPR